MIESIKQPEFTRRMQVTLRDDLDPDVLESLRPQFQEKTLYRIASLRRGGGSEPVAWLGPSDMTDEEILQFEALDDEERAERFPDVFPVQLAHIKPAHN